MLSTHNLPEVQLTCSRMIIINDGRKVADGTADELEAQGAQLGRYVITVRPDGDTAEAIASKLGALEGVQSVERIEQRGGAIRYRVQTPGDRDVSEAVYRLAVESGWTLRELRREVMDLERIFHELTQRDLKLSRDDAGREASHA